MRRIEWRESVRAGLLAIIDYISGESPDAAQCMKNNIEAKAIGLAEYSNRHRTGRVADTREMVVHPNDLIIYSVADESVVILRILHAVQQWPPSAAQLKAGIGRRRLTDVDFIIFPRQFRMSALLLQIA